MYGYKQPLVLEEIKTPDISPTQVLVRVGGAGMCRSDVQLIVGGVKNSGYGRELSHFGAHAFVNAQTVWIENPSEALAA
jgi:D-arabinose 1-dehydrogenase-like Zn-dependent alcohol dehydrogenase